MALDWVVVATLGVIFVADGSLCTLEMPDGVHCRLEGIQLT